MDTEKIKEALEKEITRLEKAGAILIDEGVTTVNPWQHKIEELKSYLKTLYVLHKS